MQLLKNIIKKVTNALCYRRRKRYHEKMKQRLENQSFSLIASDCFASFVYHDMGLQFRSPTINLFFAKEDFCTFACNLEGYFASELTEVKNHDRHFPVGQLIYNDVPIKIFFMHYKTFEEAKEKWDIRKTRVDFSNIYIIQTIHTGLTEEDVARFNKIPYKNKLLVTHKRFDDNENIYVHPIFDRKNYKTGTILRYRHLFSKKRPMDDVDYISFLNRPQ